MTGSLRAGVMTGEQWVFEERTTDPATTLEGERWLRTDLAPETNQIATLRVDVGSSVVDVPVFATGTSESGVDEALRVRVGGQDGYIPITSPGDATFNNLRMQHAGSTLAYHDRVAPGSAIPDSGNLQAQWAARLLSGYADGDTVDPFTDQQGNYDATAVGAPTYRTNQINGQPAVDYDGVDDAHDTGLVWDTNNARSIYLVLSSTEADSNTYNYGAVNVGTNNRTTVGMEPDAGTYRHHYADSNAAQGTPPNQTFVILSQTAGSGSSEMFENNTSIGTLSYTGQGSMSLNDIIGARSVDGTIQDYNNSRLAEILVYQADHGSSTRQDVWNYLNQHYAIF